MERIDLDHFPTYETSQRMLSRVSPVYDKSYVGKWLFQVMGMEMEGAIQYFEELRLQFAPETATWAIPYWEQRYGITPKPGDSLEARRQAVIYKRDIRAPMNPRRVEIIVEGLTGRHTTVEEDVADYTFSVTIEDADGTLNIAEVIARLKKIKPSHQNFLLNLIDPPQELIIGFAGSALSFSVTELPEWKIDYNFEQTIRTAGIFSSSSTTRLPELKKDFDFSDNYKIMGIGITASMTALPPLAEDQAHQEQGGN